MPLPTYGVFLHNGRFRFSVLATAADRVRLCLFQDNGQLVLEMEMQPEGDNWSCEVDSDVGKLVYCYAVERAGKTLYLADPFARNFNLLHIWREKKLWPAPVAGTTLAPFDWQYDRLPQIPLREMVIYEAHVRGLTILHPQLAENLRGRYRALADERMIAHLKSLGVTTVEFLPVHAKSEDPFLKKKGLTNYWGYNTLGYFAPESSYAENDAVTEFKEMVRALHRAGIEVILDVVYNHTGEGGKDETPVCFRGLAEEIYYRLAEDKSYIDYTSCGNTLNTDHPHTRALVLESLRYWAEEMHVDGFRFDLAPALFRKNGVVDFQHELMQAILSDPVLRERKLIAEPWDTGPGGYQRGAFPDPWLEWNDHFRDAARRFWKGEHAAHELRTQMLRQGRPVVNYVTCHDGFTLADLVSYERKHNEANLEDNRDGSDHNHSFNCGVEGPTDDPKVLALRRKQVRNLLVTLFFAQDIPMLLAGDELGHSQKGNNNAYCQDNAISWIDWEKKDRDLVGFIQRLVALRRELLQSNMPHAIEVPSHPHDAFGIRFDRHLLLLNAAKENVLFPIRGFAAKEILHTARYPRDEVLCDVCYVPAQSAVLLEILPGK
ncbi:MAG: alpha-amylase family glycosyl hydrolase [Turneriella sp.]|nr:alpha-amylase family glycosyl hydrolase [Turneriella sp.]